MTDSDPNSVPVKSDVWQREEGGGTCEWRRTPRITMKCHTALSMQYSETTPQRDNTAMTSMQPEAILYVTVQGSPPSSDQPNLGRGFSVG